ncbi:hypothetical protein ACFQY8_01610 [Alloscardovia venturai]|uniref:Cell surface protein n=1 Tax=Alloscardovia venturai TaxID=1769421 RepID=A0ABW2Y4P2_9BIFI
MMRRRVRHAVRWCAALIAIVAVCAMPIIGMHVPKAFAKSSSGTLTAASPSLSLHAPQEPELWLGVIAVTSQGDYVYCKQWGIDSTLTFTNSVRLPDTPQTRSMAYLLNHYRSSNDALTQAALGYLVHDYFESDQTRDAKWIPHRDYLKQNIPGLEQRVNQLWDEGTSHAVESATATVSYALEKRKGKVSIQLVNAQKQTVSGVKATVTLNGPAKFVSTGTQNIQMTSSNTPQDFDWVAAGQGEVSADVSVDVGTLDSLDSRQDFIRLGDMTQARMTAVKFDVKKSFQPTIQTKTPTAVLKEGVVPEDHVQLTVRNKALWEKGISFKATGYLYADMTAQDMQALLTSQEAQVKKSDTADSYLSRLDSLHLKRKAVAQTTISEIDTDYTVSARTLGNQNLPYNRSKDNFASWVWVIKKSDQTPEMQEWIDHDAISGLLDPLESYSTAQKLSVDSVVTEHHAIVGTTLSDRITVAGYPDDHGIYKGTPGMLWKPDLEFAQVSVYWSKNKPDRAEAPHDDTDHKLVGTWDFKAVNGTIYVGGGKPDGHDNPVHINAEAPGYYAFVYHFAGDSRVDSVDSPWNDEWECTQVTQEATPNNARIVTHVSNSHVDKGEKFNDVAVVTGSIKEGAFVTFTAYDAVENSEMMGTTRYLTHERHVRITADMKQKDGSYKVTSPEVKTDNSGTVYWKATLWNARGEILASHGLGVEGEETHVQTPPPATPKNNLAQTGTNVVSVASALAAFAGFGVITLMTLGGLRSKMNKSRRE